MSIDVEALIYRVELCNGDSPDVLKATVIDLIREYQNYAAKHQPDAIPSHASTGLDSFVTRCERGLREAEHYQYAQVSKRDLKELIYHFVRLDNAERDRQHKRESGKCQKCGFPISDAYRFCLEHEPPQEQGSQS